MQTVLLQLKIIPCDSAYAWHTIYFQYNRGLFYYASKHAINVLSATEVYNGKVN